MPPTTPKEAIEQVFQDIGGQRQFSSWAREHPTIFYTQLYPRLLPLTVDQNTKLEITLSWLHSRPVRPALANDIVDAATPIGLLSAPWARDVMEQDALALAAQEAEQDHG